MVYELEEIKNIVAKIAGSLPISKVILTIGRNGLIRTVMGTPTCFMQLAGRSTFPTVRLKALKKTLKFSTNGLIKHSTLGFR